MNSPLKNALLAFVIAGFIFGTGFWVSDRLNQLRVDEVRAIEQKIAIDTLSLETQFDLFRNLSCSDLTDNGVLSTELNDLASKLDYTESRLGSTNDEVIQLKKQYSLLQIKDYLLMQQVAQKCGLKPVFVLYFYSNKGDCSKCETAGNVLTYLRGQYPQLRVYSFDYNLDLGALSTLISLNKIEENLPAFVINGKTYYNLTDRESITNALPKSILVTAATSTATSTKK